MNLELIKTVVDLIEMGAVLPRDTVKCLRSAIESTLRQQTPPAAQPAQRKPLTGEEMSQIEARWDASIHCSKIAFVVRETEAAHGIKEQM